MNLLSLLEKYFPEPVSREIVVTHSRLVARMALRVARSLNDPALDLPFIEEAALLHDIGVCRTLSSRHGGSGPEPYIRHGIIGRELLEYEGLPRHALVCERHIGVGLTVADIRNQDLPLPLRDMAPISRDERIICFADLFYSKNRGDLTREKPIDEVRAGLARFGREKAEVFDRWLGEFSPILPAGSVAVCRSGAPF